MTRASRRISLRPFTEGDDDLGNWLPEAWAAIEARKPDSEAPATVNALRTTLDTRWPAAQLAAVEIGGTGVSGFIIWREEASGIGSITVIRALAVRRDRRNLGYGVATVDCLDEALPGVRLAAAIPRWNGLAVYFWLRAGFRPFCTDEDPGRTRDPGHLWMIRAARSPLTDGREDP